MKTFDIQKKFFDEILSSNNVSNTNKEIYAELILFRFTEVINSTFPIYCKCVTKNDLDIQIKNFILYGAKTSYIWQVPFEFKDYLFLHSNIKKLLKEILIFESKQISIYISSKHLKRKKISYKRRYKLSSNSAIQIHNFDIVNGTFEKIAPKYYLIYKNIDDFDIYYIEISKFLYYFLRYQRGGHTIDKAMKLASKRANINYKDAKQISKDVIENFVQIAVLE
jgi:hypothetical protein